MNALVLPIKTMLFILLLFINIVRVIVQNVSYTIAINPLEVWHMYSIHYVFGHIQVYDHKGTFLFSADTEKEVREELMEYEKSAA